MIEPPLLVSASLPVYEIHRQGSDATVRELAPIFMPGWPTSPTLYRDHDLGAKMAALSLPITAIDADCGGCENPITIV